MKKIFFLFALPLSLAAGLLHAQHNNDKKAPEVRLCNADSHTITYEQLMANPKLSVMDPVSEVIDFQISAAVTGSEYWGPYLNKGARITGDALKILTALEPGGRIFVEGIHLKRGATVLNPAAAVIYTVKPKIGFVPKKQK